MFLGMVDSYRICIPGFGLIAKPLNKVLRGPDNDLLEWMGKQQETFQRIKNLLTNVPVLGIPNFEKPCTLFVAKRQGVVLGGG